MKKRILVAEDNKQVLRVLKAQLVHAGYDVVCVEDGLDMIEKVLDESFDLILTDLMMTGGHGGKAINILRKMNIDIPVVVYSAWSDDARLPENITFLKKPMPLPEVVQKIGEVLGAPSSADTEISEGDAPV